MSFVMFPEVGVPGRCNSVHGCKNEPVAIVTTATPDGTMYSDEVCKPHLTGDGGYLDRIIYARDPNVVAIHPLPLGGEETDR